MVAMKHEYRIEEKAVAFVDICDDGYCIDRITVKLESRKIGIGTELMNEIIEDADREQVILYLIAAPLDKEGIPFKKLIQWYRKFGFFSIDETTAGEPFMKRVPERNEICISQNT